MPASTADAATALRRHLDAYLDAQRGFQPQSGGAVPPEEQALVLQSCSAAAAEADTLYVLFLFNDRLGEEQPPLVESWVEACMADARDTLPAVFAGRTVKLNVFSTFGHELAWDFE